MNASIFLNALLRLPSDLDDIVAVDYALLCYLDAPLRVNIMRCNLSKLSILSMRIAIVTEKKQKPKGNSTTTAIAAAAKA